MVIIHSGGRTGVVQLDTVTQEKKTAQQPYCKTVNQWGSRNGPGEGAIWGLSRSAQLDGKWSKDPERLREGSFIGQVTSCHIITGCATPAGNSATQFASWLRQPSVANGRLPVPRALNRTD